MNKETKDKLETAVKDVISSLNCLGSGNEAAEVISNTVKSDHRTLQQNFWRAIQGAASNYAENTCIDMRNEASVRFTKQIRELNAPLPYI